MSTREILAIAVVAFGLSIIAEWLLILTWNRTYFMVGLPIITIRIPVGAGNRDIPQLSAFEARFSSVWQSQRFRELGANKYGFRDALRLISRSIPWTHGLIFFDRENNQVLVRGFMNWYAMCVVMLSLGGFLSLIDTVKITPLIMYLLIMVVFMGAVYLVERSDYSAVAAFAAETWSRPSARNHTEA